MGPWLVVIVSKCHLCDKNVYKSNGRSLKRPTTKGTKEGYNRRFSVYTLHKIGGVGAFVYVFKLGTLTIEGQYSPVGVESPVLFCVQNQ